MKVLAKLLHIEKRPMGTSGDGKEIASVVLLSGRDALTITMFDGAIKSGKFDLYQKFLQQDALFDINCDIYKGQLQYQLGFDDPRPVTPKLAKPEAA